MCAHYHIPPSLRIRKTLVVQCVVVCCSVLQCVTVCRTVLQCVTVWCRVVQSGAEWCSVSKGVAVCCSVLQCVAVCCSVRHTLPYTDPAVAHGDASVAACYSVMSCTVPQCHALLYALTCMNRDLERRPTCVK